MQRKRFAGRRNKKVTIQQVTEATTTGGETEPTPVPFTQAWVSIEPLSAREAVIAKQEQSTTTHKITMLYVSGITDKMQAVWNGRTFYFDSVINVDEANRELEIMVTEVVG